LKNSIKAGILATALVSPMFLSGTAWASTEQCVPSAGSPATPAQGDPTIPNPDYVAPKDAVGEPTIPNPDYVAPVEGTDGFWTNFQPNNSKEPFVGPPSYPTDERGTWGEPKKNGGPQKDAEGVYANGNPNKGGNWFYRVQPVEEVKESGTPTIPNPDYVAPTDAVGEPTIPNPDYVAPREAVHPVNCPVDEPKKTCADLLPKVNITIFDPDYTLSLDGDKDGTACEKKEISKTPVSKPKGDKGQEGLNPEIEPLPATGANSTAGWVAGSAAAALLLGTGAVMYARRRNTEM
jgi:LPXTG-motif cell wall-anchored protein